MLIRTIKSLEELESIRGKWEEWQNCPNNDFDHYQLVCRMRHDSVSPHVEIVERDGDISAILIARLENTVFSPSIGYFKPLRVRTKSLTVLYQGLLGGIDVAEDQEIYQLMVHHLRSFLVSRQADMVSFHLLPENSPLLKALDNYLSPLYLEKNAQSTPHWMMIIPEKPGFILKKMRAKHRSWINSRRKKLELAYPGNVVWKWMSSFDNIPEITARLEVVAASTYQRGLGAGFVNDEEFRQRYSLFAKRGQLRVQMVEIEGKVRAFWIGMVYKGVFHSSATGFDPELRDYEIGTLMFISMTDELVREGVSKIDFGLGDAFYKERFGDQNWMETTVHMFAPNFKGTLLSLSWRYLKKIDNTLRKLLQSSGMLNRVKFGLRRLAEKRSNNG
jgi:hypothetical protein